jgi:hypothetical protein
MTIEEAVALLREARKSVSDPFCYDCCVGGEPVWGRIDAALAAHKREVEQPANEPPIGQCRLCGPRTREQTIGVYGHGERMFVCSRCGVTIRGADSAPVVEKLRGADE